MLQKFRADIYSYPVPTDLAHLSHKDRIKEVMKRSFEEIEVLKAQGLYAEIEVLNKHVFELRDQVTERMDMRVVFNNIPIDLYSLLFLTEKNGDL